MKKALTALDDAMSAAETVIGISRRQRCTQGDIEALREARDCYCHSTELIRQHLLEIKTTQSVPESEIEAMRREKASLQDQLTHKNQQLTSLLQSMRDLVSTMERWHRWELPPALLDQTSSTGVLPKMDSEVSDVDL